MMWISRDHGLSTANYYSLRPKMIVCVSNLGNIKARISLTN